MSAFRSPRRIVNGELVNAGNTNRPIDDVQSNVQYLYDLVTSAEMGTALFARGVAIAEAALQGMPVYWDADTQQFELARATAAADTGNGVTLSPSAIVAGVVYTKLDNVTADILLLGRAELDISAAVDGEVEAGRYFLSGTTYGMLTAQQPDLGIGVLYADGAGHVIVIPEQRNFLDDHRHFRIALVAKPAGTVTPPAYGDPHTIDVADDSLQGWLPADDASFDGLAPEGAKFGYNLPAHEELYQLWPPIPLSACSVFVERPPLIDDVGANLVGATMMDPRYVIIDENGIWWMSNNYNQAPWPTAYDEDGLYGSSESYSNSYAPEQHMHIWLCFSQTTYANNRNVVTRLQPKSGSPLSITNCNDEPSDVGDLYVDLVTSFLIDDADVEGCNVVKELDGVTLKTGNVIEGLIAGANVTLTSTVNRAESATPGAATVHQGITTITVDLEPTDRELSPEVVKLGASVERTLDNVIPYIGMGAGKISTVKLRYNVPFVGLPAVPLFKLRTLLLGKAAGTFPDLAASYYVVPAPGSDLVSVASVSETDLEFVTEREDFLADRIQQVESESFEISAGDTIYITITRTGVPSDGYSGEIGLVRMQGVVFSE